MSVKPRNLIDLRIVIRKQVSEQRAELNQLHVIGRKEAVVSSGSVAPPPALVHHLYSIYDVVWVKGDLSVISCEDVRPH